MMLLREHKPIINVISAERTKLKTRKKKEKKASNRKWISFSLSSGRIVFESTIK